MLNHHHQMVDIFLNLLSSHPQYYCVYRPLPITDFILFPSFPTPFYNVVTSVKINTNPKSKICMCLSSVHKILQFKTVLSYESSKNSDKFKNKHREIIQIRDQQTVFIEGVQKNEHIRFCRPYSPCHNYSTLFPQHKSSHKQ